jgi:hypothetical protein
MAIYGSTTKTATWRRWTYDQLDGLTNLMRNYIDGFTLSNNATDADHDLDIAAGSAMDSTNDNVISTTSSLTKQIDVDWAEGDDAGGFPSGLTLSADTWYHVFVLRKADGTVDAGFDTSLTATNLLADATDYIYYRRVGSIATDSSNNIRAFSQHKDRFDWHAPIETLDTSSISTTEATVQATVPAGVEVEAIVGVDLVYNGAVNVVRVYGADEADATPADNNRTVVVTTSGVDSVVLNVWVNTSQEYHYRATSATGFLKLRALGWYDPRGKE